MKEYLDRGPYWDGISDQNRLACSNGLGPESMPEVLRGALSWLFRVIEGGWRIHDVGFSYAEKSLRSWHEENDRMRDNFILLAKNEIPWWRWHKRRRFLKYWIPLFYELVESEAGWQAFKAAKKPSIHEKD